MDHLPKGISNEWLWDCFAGCGKVIDVYISKKQRPSCKDTFGFVRFDRRAEAEEAINKMDGVVVKGLKLHVTMAKYNKAGQPFHD